MLVLGERAQHDGLCHGDQWGAQSALQDTKEDQLFEVLRQAAKQRRQSEATQTG